MNTPEQLQQKDISEFVETYRGYPYLMDWDKNLVEAAYGLIYDEDIVYKEGLAPRNKLEHLNQRTLEPGRTICLGKVMNPGLEEYYIVQIFDGSPEPLVLVSERDLIPEKEA